VGKKLTAVLAAIVVVLAGLAFAQYKFSIFGGELQKDPEGDYARLTQTGAKLTAGRSARITFTASMTSLLHGPVATWSGTSLMSFAGTAPSWQTTFDKLESPQFGTITGKLVHTPAQTAFSSPALVVPDKRQWIDLKSTTSAILWPQPLADPKLGITDFSLWEDMIDSLTRAGGLNKRTKDLPDVAGAPYEYKVECYPTAGACPLPFGTLLDGYFNQLGEVPTMSAWYGKDGVLHRLDVEGDVEYNPTESDADPTGTSHPEGPHHYRASFTLDQFGTPVTVTPIADGKLTQSHFIDLQGHS
jgi:hypothetical protein